MSYNKHICRLCLAIDVKLFRISGNLEQVFETITSTKLHTQDGRPVVACYICYANLNRCHKIILTSVRAENVLSAIVHSNTQISVKTVSQFDRHVNGLTNNLSRSSGEYFDSLARDSFIKPEVKLDIKREELDVPLQPLNVNQDNELTVKFEEETNYDIKIEPIEECDLSPYTSEVDVTGDDYVLEPMERTSINQETEGTNRRKRKTPRKSKSKSNSETHSCNFCSRTYKQRCHLLRHLKIHIDDKSYKCSICKRRFFRRDVLENHFKKIHCESKEKKPKTVKNLEKPFKCQYCERTFSRKDNMVVHIRTHTGVRPYQCDFCMRRFIFRSNIVSHLRTHLAEEPFECYICFQRFIAREHLQSHLKMHWV